MRHQLNKFKLNDVVKCVADVVGETYIHRKGECLPITKANIDDINDVYNQNNYFLWHRS